MRTPHRIGLIASITAIVLSGCGGGSSGEDAAPAAQTRTVTSTFTGKEVKVPAEPKRVVALWRTGAELVDLGVKPVGALDGELLEEELGSEVYATVKDTPEIGTFEGVDVEKVIELEPDLIIGMDNGGLRIDYEELEEIAPTVVLKIAEPPDVWANYPTLAEIVGEETDFDKNQAELERDLKAVDQEFGGAIGDLESTSIGSFDGPIFVDTTKSLIVERILLAGFGYNPDYSDKPKRYVEELSAENIANLADQDVIFYDVGLDGEPSPATQKVLDLASFKRLPAARAGHVFPLTSGTIYTFDGGQRQADDLRTAAEKLAEEG